MKNFEDIMSGKVQATPEEVQEALEVTVRSFTDLKLLNDFLLKLHPDDVHDIILNVIHPSTNILIKRASQAEDLSEYQRFQDIQMEAKKMYEYYNRTATIKEVNQIASTIAQQFYGISVRMISLLDDELGKVEQAINKIEEHLGLDVTNFAEENKNDTTEPSNEQGSEKTIN